MAPRLRPITLPGGGTARRIIDLAGGGEPVTHKIEFLQLAARDDVPTFRQVFEVTGRYTLVRRRCPDCNGRPETIPPAEGFTAAILLIHDSSCPAFMGAVALYRAGGAL